MRRSKAKDKLADMIDPQLAEALLRLTMAGVTPEQYEMQYRAVQDPKHRDYDRLGRWLSKRT